MIIKSGGMYIVNYCPAITNDSDNVSIPYYLGGELIDDPAKWQPNRIRSDYGGMIFVGLFGSDAAATRGSLYFAAQSPLRMQLMRYTYDQSAVYSLHINSVDPWYAAFGLYVAMQSVFDEDVPNPGGIPYYYGRYSVTQFCTDIKEFLDGPFQMTGQNAFLTGWRVGQLLWRSN